MPDPLIVDPALQASVIRQFNLRGELSPFLLTNRVVPTFDIGTLVRPIDPTVVTTLDGSQGLRVGLLQSNRSLITGEEPFGTGDIQDGGTVINPGANTVLLAGLAAASSASFRVKITTSANVVVDFLIAHRNAANSADLETWTVLSGGPSAVPFVFDISYFLAFNERIRVSNVGAVVGTVATTLSQIAYTPSIAS